MGRKALLAIDAGANLILGAGLIWFPSRLVAALGIPQSDGAFYPSILGSVLLGVGIALLMECCRPARRVEGLGLGGAVAINVSGGVVLAGWLVFGDLSLPSRGEWLLWGLVVFLLGISAVESVRQARSSEEGA